MTMTVPDSFANSPRGIYICQHCLLKDCVNTGHMACPLRREYEGKPLYDTAVFSQIAFDNEVREAVASCLN